MASQVEPQIAQRHSQMMSARRPETRPGSETSGGRTIEGSATRGADGVSDRAGVQGAEVTGASRVGGGAMIETISMLTQFLSNATLLL